MIDFTNMLDKPLLHCFVPADKASVTFVFQDGMRRSFGVGPGNVDILMTNGKEEGCKIKKVLDLLHDDHGYVLRFATDRGDIDFVYRLPPGGALVEMVE
jgi:hypothetical protein